MKSIVEISKFYYEALYKISDGGVIGHFLPAIENGIKGERAFLRNGTAGVKTRPYAWISVDSEHGQLLFYKHCASEDFMDSEQFTPTDEIDISFISPRSALEQITKERELLSSYNTIRDIAFRPDLSNSQKESLREFLKIWEDTICTGLKPYYRALAPDFFCWAEESI